MYYHVIITTFYWFHFYFPEPEKGILRSVPTPWFCGYSILELTNTLQDTKDNLIAKDHWHTSLIHEEWPEQETWIFQKSLSWPAPDDLGGKFHSSGLLVLLTHQDIWVYVFRVNKNS